MCTSPKHSYFKLSAGFSIAEVLVAASVLGLLLGLHLMLFQIGFSGWHKIETSGNLNQQLQLAGQQWIRDCKLTSANFIDVEDAAMSLLLPPSEEQGELIAPGTGDIRWGATALYFLEATKREFRLRVLEWQDVSNDGAHISQIDFSDGMHPLSFYRNDGKILARFIDEAKFDSSQGLWELKLKASNIRYGHPDKESLEARFVARPHNF